MASTSLSRLGQAPGTGVKEPCAAVSQGAPITRSGLYTLGGVVLLAGMRVFDKDAADPTEIGVYIASAGPWQRASDWNKDDDVRSGVIIAALSAGGITETYQVTFTGGHEIGSTSYVVTRFDVNAGTLALQYGRIFADTYAAAVAIAAPPVTPNGTVFEIAADEAAPAPYTNKPTIRTKTAGVLGAATPAEQIRIDLASSVNGGGSDLVVNALRRFDNIAELTAYPKHTLSPTVEQTAVVTSFYSGWAANARGPQGGGRFIWSAASTATAVQGFIVNPSGNVGAGRWIREIVDGVSVIDGGALPVINSLVAASGANQTATRQAWQAAINFLILIGGGRLKVPAGYHHIDNTVEISPTLVAGYPTQPDGMGLPFELDAEEGAYLVINHATATALRAYHPSLAGFSASKLTIAGRGSATNGMLLEINGVQNWKLDDCRFVGHGGVGLFLTAAAERGNVSKIQFYNCRQSIKTGIGATNECYFDNLLEVNCGRASDQFTGGLAGTTVSYNQNTAGSGLYKSESRSVRRIRNAVNMRFIGGSCKVTELAGVKYNLCENIVDNNRYYEGYGLYANPSIIVGGCSEKTTLTAPITSEALTATVADQKWFTQISTDARFDLGGVDTQPFVIYEPGVPGTYEVVTVNSFRNGTMNIAARGQFSTTARAWSGSAIVREYLNVVGGGPSDVTCDDNHLESYQTVPAGYSGVASDVANGDTQGEVVVGYTADDFHFNAAGISFMPGTSAMRHSGNVMRNFPAANSSKFQANRNAAFFSKYDVSPSLYFQADTNISNPTYSLYGVAAPNYKFISNSSNNVPESLRVAIDLVALGGYGTTKIIAGERGTAIAKTSLAATELLCVDDRTVNGAKYYENVSGTWTVRTGLTKTAVLAGGVNVGMFYNTGTPNGVVVAQPGSICLNLSGGAGVSLYKKETGTGNTGWVAI